MMPEICECEKSVLAALAAGSISSEVRQHLDVCPGCAESVAVWQYLQTLASRPVSDGPLPSADLIWWRAQLAEKRRLAARSVAAIEMVQRAAILLIAGLAAVAATLWGSNIFGGITLPLPVALGAILLGMGSVGGMFYAWRQGHWTRVFARQR
jgi:hypothetical protein